MGMKILVAQMCEEVVDKHPLHANITEMDTYLKDFLHISGNCIMLHSNDIRVKNTRCGIQGIYSRVDTQLRDTSGQYSGRVQMSERRGWGRISQIISRHVNSLNNISKFCSSNIIFQIEHPSYQNRRLSHRHTQNEAIITPPYTKRGDYRTARHKTIIF